MGPNRRKMEDERASLGREASICFLAQQFTPGAHAPAPAFATSQSLYESGNWRFGPNAAPDQVRSGEAADMTALQALELGWFCHL
jgi:hypothetical protein